MTASVGLINNIREAAWSGCRHWPVHSKWWCVSGWRIGWCVLMQMRVLMAWITRWLQGMKKSKIIWERTQKILYNWLSVVWMVLIIIWLVVNVLWLFNLVRFVCFRIFNGFLFLIFWLFLKFGVVLQFWKEGWLNTNTCLRDFFLILTRLDDFRLPLLSDLIYSTKSDQENLANRTSWLSWRRKIILCCLW